MKVYRAHIEMVLMAMTIGFSMNSCIDPFEIESVDFQSAIVIEATITDEDKQQEILISRTFSLDTTGLYAERGAAVVVTSSEGTIYNFSETDEGKYLSNTSFAAQAGSGYRLSVTTSDGSSYSSDEVVTPQPTKIDNLYAERDFKDGDANEGMFIYVDSQDPTGTNTYFRYDYEETYKIIAPFWNASELYIVPETGLPGDRLRTREERVCFNTLLSNAIILANTADLNENRLTKFPVRFISREEYILSHRYTILVSQYAQSRVAYDYYETLLALSASESLFSQIQTGFLSGNISSVDTRNEYVIGYFDVSSVSRKRLFFNYDDFFFGERPPDYLSDCQLFSLVDGALISQIELDLVNMFDYYDPIANPRNFSGEGTPGNYLISFDECSDCNIFGSNIVPDFWVE